MKKSGAQLRLVLSRNEAPLRKVANSFAPLSTIDLFCGAGGITEGFREAGYRCQYGNDSMPEAIETFLFNHPDTWAEARGVESVDPADVRSGENPRIRLIEETRCDRCERQRVSR